MTYFSRWVSFGVFVLAMSCLSGLHAEDWGSLTGHFIYAGEPPARKPTKITKDKEYCGKCNLLEEDLVVDPKTRGVASVIVWLYVASRKPSPAIYPGYAETENKSVPIDSDKCRISPHVTLFRTTQVLLIRNTDPIGDGIKIDTFRNNPVNLALAPHAEVEHRFPNPERLPTRVSCPIHSWESGWMLILDHPYMGFSNTEGQFEIKNIPAGKWAFQFWHEKAGYLDEVRIAGKPQSWRRGRVEIDIQTGTNDLGAIELVPEIFKK